MKHYRWVALLALIPASVGAQNARFDGKEPIEITSDQLQVEQQQNIAIFSGNVVAIQKDVRLKSDKMTVYYTGGEEKKSDAPQNNTQAPAAPKQSIKKIEVEGNVFLSTPEETASGARGNYDVVGEEIHLFDNVVLTHGENTLTGNQLTYNFASGHSTITGGPIAESGASKGKERVRALFVPDKENQPPVTKP